MPEPVLYGYWRSSAAYRVRIALNLKQIAAESAFVHLRRGDQRGERHRALNPAGLVPVWREADGFTLAQSLAIIDYLDEIHPEPPFLPEDVRLRAICREIAYAIACDIHPLGNLRVLEKLAADFAADSTAKAAWARHWIASGFEAIEARLAHTAGCYAIGDQITLADICLVPQVANARRFGLDLALYPRIAAADAAAREDLAFAAAAPEMQPDAE
ncbi:maleylacetoacetate isomerase [Methylocapsa aurea]|uniref:maleylacetoacetate isomerase n=1 Tax=Methylocapsa aurea TaxID=663610 RepID=UPI000564E6F2|nr:maleylacetoacetate isomerase [Methylocapsa aurea]